MVQCRMACSCRRADDPWPAPLWRRGQPGGTRKAAAPQKGYPAGPKFSHALHAICWFATCQPQRATQAVYAMYARAGLESWDGRGAR